MSDVAPTSPCRGSSGDGPVSQVLYRRGAPTWARAVAHPMVRAIGDGTLPHATFRGYFEQNVLYLQEYARAIGSLVARAPDRDAIEVLTRFLHQIVAVEIPANVAFLDRLGGTPPAEPVADLLPAAYAYTRHLLAAAQEGTSIGLAALLPCQWSYGDIGTDLARHRPDDAVLADWIDLFAGGGYGRLVAESTGLLDRLCGRLDPVRLAGHQAVFDRSTRYEVEFWDMAWSLGRPESGAGGP